VPSLKVLQFGRDSDIGRAADIDSDQGCDIGDREMIPGDELAVGEFRVEPFEPLERVAPAKSTCGNLRAAGTSNVRSGSL
jgi:hypothetical protein